MNEEDDDLFITALPTSDRLEIDEFKLDGVSLLHANPNANRKIDCKSE
jgi:hypothetical protein